MDMMCPCSSHREPLQQAFSEGETDFRLCRVCGLVFRNKFPTPNELDEIYKQAYSAENISYADTNQESGDYAIEAYAAFLTKTIIKPGMRVLDFGAATGTLVAQLQHSGVAVDGVEYSAEAREFCAATRGFKLMSGLDVILPGTYDVVTMIEVIEHVTDLQATLLNLRKVLKLGGLIFITTPNRKGIRAIMEGGHWREARKKFHLILFDKQSLKFHLGETGFVDIHRVVFSPVQKKGIKFWMVARATQLLGVPGSLCMVGHLA